MVFTMLFVVLRGFSLLSACNARNTKLPAMRVENILALQIKILLSSIAIVQVTNSQEGRSGHGT